MEGEKVWKCQNLTLTLFYKVLFMDSQHPPLETLQDIKRMMERSSRFISLSGWSGISAGICALAGAWVAHSRIASYLKAVSGGGDFRGRPGAYGGDSTRGANAGDDGRSDLVLRGFWSLHCGGSHVPQERRACPGQR